MDRRKKELQEQYKQRKPDMGVFVVRHLKSNRCFLEASADVPSMFNRIRFQLDMGRHPNPRLQQAWQEGRPEDFAFEVIDRLEYSRDESKTDYRDDLSTLKSIWREKLQAEDVEFY